MTTERSSGVADGSDTAETANPFDKKSQRHKKRTTLLNEALRMIHERGVASISLDDLAANLEISKGTVYYYFKSKDELLFECYSISFDIWEHALEVAETSAGSGGDRIERFLRSYLNEGLGTLHAVIYFREQSSLNGTYREEAENRRKELRDRMRALVAEGNADGSLAGVNPKISATVLGASITWLLRAYQGDAGRSKAEYIDDAVAILLNGLKRR